MCSKYRAGASCIVATCTLLLLSHAPSYRSRYVGYLSVEHQTQETNSTVVQPVEPIKTTLKPIPSPHLCRARRQFNRWLEASELGKVKHTPFHVLSSTEPYKSRLRNIAHKCEVSTEGNKRIDLSRMLFDDKRKVVMCVVPKAASTTWKRIMWYLDGCESNKDKVMKINPALLDFTARRMKTLSSVSKQAAIARLRSYTKVFITREPMERFVSAYRSKFITSLNPNYRNTIGRNIAVEHVRKLFREFPRNIRRLLKGNLSIDDIMNDVRVRSMNVTNREELRKYLGIIKQGNITFQHFARFVASAADRKYPYQLDVHWRPQVDLCSPCSMTYDYVIDFQKLAVESNRLLKFIQRNDDENQQIRLDESQHAETDKDTISECMDNIDINVKKRIEQLYAADSFILGYESAPEPS